MFTPTSIFSVVNPQIPVVTFVHYYGAVDATIIAPFPSGADVNVFTVNGDE